MKRQVQLTSRPCLPLQNGNSEWLQLPLEQHRLLPSPQPVARAPPPFDPLRKLGSHQSHAGPAFSPRRQPHRGFNIFRGSPTSPLADVQRRPVPGAIARQAAASPPSKPQESLLWEKKRKKAAAFGIPTEDAGDLADARPAGRVSSLTARIPSLVAEAAQCGAHHGEAVQPQSEHAAVERQSGARKKAKRLIRRMVIEDDSDKDVDAERAQGGNSGEAEAGAAPGGRVCGQPEDESPHVEEPLDNGEAERVYKKMRSMVRSPAAHPNQSCKTQTVGPNLHHAGCLLSMQPCSSLQGHPACAYR